MLWSGVLIGLGTGILVGGPAVWFAVKRQVRRARAIERRARDQARLAEIGAMTAGLAHEIKNPLSTIGLNAQLLGEAIADLEIDEDDKRRLVRRTGVVEREAERLRDTLTDFLAFAGEVRLVTEPTDLNGIADELIDFFLPQAQHHGVRLRSELHPTPLTVDADRDQLKQAALNLMLNAVQAMVEQGGSGRARELIVRTSRQTTDLGAAACALHVIDTGPGIPAEVAAKVFEPYFTTKRGGSGLGLPTTKRLVEEHGGTLEVHSDVGRGTDFAIVLPEATSITPPSPPAPPSARTAR